MARYITTTHISYNYAPPQTSFYALPVLVVQLLLVSFLLYNYYVGSYAKVYARIKRSQLHIIRHLSF